MTDLRKLLDAATKARADVAKDEGEAGENYRAYMRAKHALKTEALNALPALPEIVAALERDEQDAARYRWLLDTFFSDSNASHLIGRCNTPAELDEAIDRAIKDRT